jgi:hypothetical protein
LEECYFWNFRYLQKDGWTIGVYKIGIMRINCEGWFMLT